MNLQQLILALQSFWSQQGCIVGQPYDVEKGAGTGNPHTYLRALGPEPWNVAYVEPCRRPTDGRYGENPNRLGAYYQFQVLMKPSPTDVLDRYLRSLTALGIRPREHDIRFVEDDWEQATLGAWGLGWEVWLDGMEITQFTYFQQVGGLECRPVSAEMTYGIERIAMYLQDVDSIFDLEWGGGFTYRDVHHQTEVEWSKYNFEHADPKVLLQLFEHYRAESLRLGELGLVFPAYDCALKASHTFNTLEARGAISVSERAAFLGRIRDLSRRAAEVYVQEREKLNFPLLGADLARTQSFVPSEAEKTAFMEVTEAKLHKVKPEPVLIELGVEEIPARFLREGSKALQDAVVGFLESKNIEHGEARSWHTPRRLVVHVADVQPYSAASVEVVNGPPVRIAFDADGNPKVPATKFAASQGVAVDALIRVQTPKGEYLAYEKKVGNEVAFEVLEDALPALLAGLPWRKSMRWADLDDRFVRPVQWLVALFGPYTLRVEFAGISSGNNSRGHRFFGNETFAVWNLETLRDGLSARHVTLDPAERRRIIRTQLEQVAGEHGGEPVHDESLLTEVVGLVEAPRVICGSFEERFLQLPREVIRTILTYHQKMFAVDDGDGNLLPKFLGVSNNPSPEQPSVRKGYEKVVAARLSDGAFFFEQDRKRSLAQWGEELSRRTFLKGMGTLADKTERIVALVHDLAPSGAQEDVRRAVRAAQLCKADLCTHLVGEFPELQGEIGRIYAAADGEGEMVAEAIFEHHLPRGADDVLPVTVSGALVALADKADTLAACFALGKAPTGSADPYGLRRAALGLLRILMARHVHAPVDGLVGAAVAGVTDRSKLDKDALAEGLLGFLRTRLKGLLVADGHPADFVEAVLLAGWEDVVDARARVEALVGLRGSEGFDDLMVGVKRIANILRKAGGTEAQADPALFEQDAERDLHEAFVALRGRVDEALGQEEYPDALAAMAELRSPLARFFDDVMVMADDEAVRNNRFALLDAILGTFSRVADFSAISSD